MAADGAMHGLGRRQPAWQPWQAACANGAAGPGQRERGYGPLTATGS